MLIDMALAPANRRRPLSRVLRVAPIIFSDESLWEMPPAPWHVYG